jgi:hypothetical protein
MATTTPNFGWSVPTSTDLVKDGATAIETLGDAIDASLVDLKGGTTNQVLAKNSNTDMDFKWVADASGIPATAFTAKGDLLVGTGSGTYVAQAVGANGTVLIADSAQADGVRWGAASSGLTWSLKSTTTMSGAISRTVSSLSSKAYLILFEGVSANAYDSIDITFNSDTTNNYGFLFSQLNGGTTFGTSSFSASGSVLDPRIRVGSISATATSTISGGLTITSADSTGFKPFISTFGCNAQGGIDGQSRFGQGFYKGTSAITSITATSTGSNFDAGTMYIYGGD